jgi:hypothetical protein
MIAKPLAGRAPLPVRFQLDHFTDDRFTVAVGILANPLNQLRDVVQRPGSLMPEILTGGAAIELLMQFPQIGQIDLKYLGGGEAVLAQEKGEKVLNRRGKLKGSSGIGNGLNNAEGQQLINHRRWIGITLGGYAFNLVAQFGLGKSLAVIEEIQHQRIIPGSETEKTLRIGSHYLLYFFSSGFGFVH